MHPMNSYQKNTSSLSKTQKMRDFKDLLARYLVKTGGVSVIIAICLIFLYLLYEVVPLFYPADVNKASEYIIPGDSSPTLYLTIEDRLEATTRVTAKGQIYFFNSVSGKIIHTELLKLPANTHITSHFKTEPSEGLNDDDEKKLSKEITIFGLSDGSAIIARHYFAVSHSPSGKRIIKPKLDYPFSDKPIIISQNNSIKKISAEWNEDGISIVSLNDRGKIQLTYLEKSSALGEDEASFEQSQITIAELPVNSIVALLINKTQNNVYILNNKNGLSYYDVTNKQLAKLIQHIPSVTPKSNVSEIKFLVGGLSLLIGTQDGRVMQWFPVRDQKNNFSLQKIREFKKQDSSIVKLSTEYSRKGFATIDSKGRLAIYHSTANKIIYNKIIGQKTYKSIYLSPRANAVLLETNKNSIQFWTIKNEHPEVSWSALWTKNWYESYPGPQYTWQSSSSTDDFEPKYSLMPLSFGTLKAAFYAMAISVPLAIMGAIFTAYFMAPRMRQIVKPGIEIMEALPTVIIGFLAGLWLAPIIDQNLAAIFLILVTIPLGILLASYAWHRMPDGIRHRVPDGWEAALLVPVILFIIWVTFSVFGPAFEYGFFDGSMSHWLSNKENPIAYDQRNSIIVGLAMGFAIIPTIFSIAEDAIFAVPKHLTQGSLALGATQWQTLSKVILLTASPGMFSAVMIGFGRAIGETMIVLMATGNTPIMDASIFQGMRTLSANIAVELPESAQHSTHFRILFLAALTLFLFTFLFNTIAEVVRQRLRTKYSNL